MQTFPRRVALAPALLAAVGLLVSAPEVGAAARGPWARHARLIARADSLLVAGRLAACRALLDSCVAAASVSRDRGLERIARIRRAQLDVTLRRTAPARQDADAALADARVAADTLSQCRALVVLGTIESIEPDPTTTSARRALAIARRAGLSSERGAAWIAIGTAELNAGRLDESTNAYRRALPLLARPGDWRAAMSAHAGLVRCLITQNDYAGARREHAIVLREALRHGDRIQLTETWHNLGIIEHSGGNPAEAEGHYRRSAEVADEIGLTWRAISARRLLALLFVNLGRVAQSESVLTRVLPQAEALGDPQMRGLVYSQLGVAYRQLARYREAEAFGRRAIALSDSVLAGLALPFISTLSATLVGAGKGSDALAMVESQLRRLDRRLTKRDRDDLNANRAGLLVALGRPREAIAALQPTLVDAPAVAGLAGYDAIFRRDQLARCYRALGERDSALACYRDATERWEVARRGVTDKSWREGLDNVANEFSGHYATLLLDPAGGGTADGRARDAFDMLQRFRARTLSERVRGPGAGDVAGFAPIDLATLRKRALEPGEAFVDIYFSRDTTLVFVVTRDRILASATAGSLKLWPRLRRLRDLLVEPSDANRAALADAARALGSDLFGPMGAVLAASSRVFLSAGSFARYPLGALVVPGENEALNVAHQVAIIPSATLLAMSRSRRGPAPATARVLAVATTRDTAGRTVPAAAREARRLARDYEGAEAFVDARWTAEQFAVRDLRGYSVLHFASHTSANTSQPWHSGIQIADARVSGGSLSAARIARLRVPARLCVLSSCSSLGGRNDPGETLYGLAAAWLAAGVPTVIATQWDADDRALAEFTPRFYAHLARGETAGAALRAAAAELRADPKYAAPYYWQGIVLLGDPETRIPLRPRRAGARAPAAGVMTE